MTDEELAAFDAKCGLYISDVVIGPDPPTLSPEGQEVIRRTFGGIPDPAV